MVKAASVATKVLGGTTASQTPAALVDLVREGPFAAVLSDRNLKITHVARTWTAETGMRAEDMVGKRLSEIFPDCASLPDLLLSSLTGKRSCSEPIAVGVNGNPALFRLESGAWRHEDGAIGGVVTFGRDVTAVLESRRQIERSERRLKLALEIDRSLVWEKDLSSGQIDVTGSLAELLPDLRSGADPLSLVHPEERPKAEQDWKRHAERGLPFELEFLHHAANGGKLWLRNVQTVVHGADGRPEFVIGVSKDVSQRHAAEAEIERLAYRDTLTGLSNRAWFQREFHAAVEQAKRRNRPLGLIILDVDNFKDVNDTFGHDTGDALLRSLGELLERAFRKTDIIARLGGDEFAVVLPQIGGAHELMRPIETLLNLLREPILHNGRSFTIGASVGAALLTPEDDPAQLLKNADIALYQAKFGGRNRVVLFESEMRTTVEARIDVLRQVRAAFQNDEFVLYYQPVVDLQGAMVAGFEALMRWRHPEKGVLTPDHFMAAFEDQDLSLKLGDLAFDLALQQMRAWQEQGIDYGRVAVNVSSAQFRNGALAETVSAKLKHWGVPAERLTIEVTENVYMGWNTNVVSDTIKALHDAGVMIALDDFGTGYASLANLRQFPIDRLKIDRSFVQNPQDDAIVRAVIGLGASMGMKVVAEGVEREDQLEALKRYGCDQVQGYHFARPMPAAEVPDFLRRVPELVRAS
jgi:diguanylate cyclase (GGDEF)-like protein